MKRTWRIAGIAAAILITAGGLLAAGPGGARAIPAAAAQPGTVFNTMRPAHNTAYCVADLNGAGGRISLINPCNRGGVESWGVENSAYGGGSFQIQNLVTGLCMADPFNGGSGTHMTAAPCNGIQAEAWIELPFTGYTVWESEVSEGLCIDGTVQNGMRVYTCNQSASQQWLGPE